MKFLLYPEIPEGSFDLGVFISPNGAGHHKRVFGALDLVLRAKPDTKVLVFAEQKVTERFMGDFEPLQRIAANSNVIFIFGVVSPGMDIMEKDPMAYLDRRWFNWIGRTDPYVPALQNAFIWGDAVPLILKRWTNVLFSSSFTFGPVIEERWSKRNDELGEVARLYAGDEKRLMRKYRPVWVCPKIFAMPSMYEQANVKEVGVMADFVPLPKVKTERPLIGFSGGLTGLAGEVLGQVVQILLDDGSFDLVVDDKIREKFPDLPLLGNDAAAYAPLSVCVIRPGVGSSTNCITSATPVVAISEPDDLEMKNNGQRFQQYGLGIQIHKAGDILGALNTILSPEWQKYYALAHAQVGLNGLQELADEIIVRL